MAYPTSVERPAVPTASTPRLDRDASKNWRIAGYAVAGILALVPALRMAGIVFDGSALQYTDYWQMFGRFTNPDGGLDIAGLFHFQNEHPMVFAQLVYWLNARFLTGSNIALGVFAIALVLGQLVVIAMLLWRSAFRPVERIAIFVLASALLFDLSGTWNFSKAMSGTAWFSANLFAITAVYLRSRHRCVPAFALAALAALSYGTGVMAWLAVIATGVSGRPVRQWWRDWPYFAGFAVTVVWYRLSGPPGNPGSSDLVATFRLAASLLGSIFGLHGDVSELVGWVALIGVPVLAVRLGLFSRAAGVAGWVGVATFGWCATLEIASSRSEFVALFGTRNRYSSLAALTWLGFVSLAVYAIRGAGNRLSKRRPGAPAVAFRSPWISVALIAPLLIGAMTAGRDHADAMLALRHDQELAEITLRLGLVDNTRFLMGAFGQQADPPSRDLLIEMGNFPFVRGWDLDCGLDGQRLDVRETDDASTGNGSLLSAEPAPLARAAIQITGYTSVTDPIRCIVITDDADVVVGAATVGVRDLAASETLPADVTRFTARARRGSTSYRAIAVLDNGERRFIGRIPVAGAAG